jgi:hypothetical protein
LRVHGSGTQAANQGTIGVMLNRPRVPLGVSVTRASLRFRLSAPRDLSKVERV